MKKHFFRGTRVSLCSVLAALLIVVSVITMIWFGSQKEGLHIDEVYSYGLANSEYLPFMHFGTMEYSVKDWMMEYGPGESLSDLFSNLLYDFKLLKESNFQWKETVIYQDYLIAQANSADTYTTTWVSGQDYQDYLAVSESNTFNYASVYYNQRGDVHPPLFYILLHTICSIFQGSFSVWYALGLNIAILALTEILLYRMVRRYLGGEKIALCTLAIYGLSCGIMTTAVFLRMYALLTFMVTACLYVHLKIADEDDTVKGRNRFLLMVTVLGGFLTHYYFVIFAIMIAAVSVCRMLWRKKFKKIFQYVLTLALSAVIGLAVWPFALKHVFSGYRGQQALSALSGEFYFIKFRLMVRMIVIYLFGGHWWILWTALALTAVACGLYLFSRYQRKKQGVTEVCSRTAEEIAPVSSAEDVKIPEITKEHLNKDEEPQMQETVANGFRADTDILTAKNEPLKDTEEHSEVTEIYPEVAKTHSDVTNMATEKESSRKPGFWSRFGNGNIPWAKGCLVVLPTLGYTYLVSQIVPIFVERYVMCTFPLWCLFMVAGPALLLKELSLSQKWKTGLLALLGAVVLWSGICYLYGPGYLYTDGQLTVEIPENTYCVYVLQDGNYNESAVDSTLLAQCESVAVVHEGNLDVLTDTYEYNEGDTIAIAVQDDLELESVVAKVKEVLGVEDLTEVSQWQSQVAVFVFCE